MILKIGISNKIVLFVFIVVITISAGGLVVSYFGMEKLSEDISFNSLMMKVKGDIESFNMAFNSEYGAARIKSGKMVDDKGKPIDSFEFIDDFGERLGITATIFKSEGDDFIRIVTNIQKDDGSRAVGTYLGEESAAYRPIMNKERFLGRASILGHNYLTAYDPLLNGQDELIGILYVGIPIDEINAMADRLAGNIISILLGVFATLTIAGLGIGWFISKRIAKPITAGVALTEKVSEGDLDVEVPPVYMRRKDEIGQLAQALSDMVEALRQKAEVAEKIANRDLTEDVRLASDK
ncbi:MAG: Cache 3/Cache 2 fusion domain-containing protein, partial [Spirochaetia bacterium]